MKRKRLTDLVSIETVPQKNKVYPKGTIIIQLSASRGQVYYLDAPSEIEEHFAVLTSKAGYSSYYLFCVIRRAFLPFFYQRKQGLNFRAEELQQLILPIHQDKAKQRQFVQMMKLWGEEQAAFYIYKCKEG